MDSDHSVDRGCEDLRPSGGRHARIAVSAVAADDVASGRKSWAGCGPGEPTGNYDTTSSPSTHAPAGWPAAGRRVREVPEVVPGSSRVHHVGAEVLLYTKPDSAGSIRYLLDVPVGSS
jgi:hypothetical protein